MSLTDHTPFSKRKFSIKKWFTENWLIFLFALYGIWVWVPFFAPVFMRLGWETPANVIYWTYSFFCHQLPDRSYFLFGQRISYSLTEIQDVWMDTSNPLLLRKFIGNPEMGWKVGWSDRMISFYGGIWVFAISMFPFRNKIKKLPFWGMVLFLFPMIIDGGSHFISEFSGYQEGFRFTNIWLASLTKNQLSATFYTGNMLGSFNSWMRIISGAIAGFGISWFILSSVKSDPSQYNA